MNSSNFYVYNLHGQQFQIFRISSWNIMNSYNCIQIASAFRHIPLKYCPPDDVRRRSRRVLLISVISQWASYCWLLLCSFFDAMVLVVVSMNMQELKKISTLLQWIDFFFMYKRCLKKKNVVLSCVDSFWWNKLEDYKKQIHNTSTNKKSCLLFCFLHCLRIALDALCGSLTLTQIDQSMQWSEKKKTMCNSDPLGCFRLSPKLAHRFISDSRAETGGIIMLFFGWGSHQLLAERHWVSQGWWLSICQIKTSQWVLVFFLVRWIYASKNTFFTSRPTHNKPNIDFYTFTCTHIGRIDNKQDLKILPTEYKQMVLWNPVSFSPALTSPSLDRSTETAGGAKYETGGKITLHNDALRWAPW